MSETTPNSKGPAPAQYKPAATEPALIPADQAKPEDIGTLTYANGKAVLSLTEGRLIPAGLTVVNESGEPLAVYTVGPIPDGMGSTGWAGNVMFYDPWSDFSKPGGF
ncbi:hypothetical protein ACFQ7Z_35670 [Streptomyces virginiae]|uniref:hypothetical protein n=1 Tax=Streptomyces virginiae TaxID=1961 RepID=UPI00369ECB9B